MKKLLLFCIFFGALMVAQAQKVYFVYLQTENSQPFYVKMGDEVLSSTASGYLIISGMKDSTYALLAGFPGQRAEEARFNVPVSGKDRGFLLKKLDDKWVLFDLQTMAVIRPQEVATGQKQVGVRNDHFSQTLSLAADDPGLLIVWEDVAEPVQKEERRKRGEKSEPARDMAAATAPTEEKPPVDTAALVNEEVKVKEEGKPLREETRPASDVPPVTAEVTSTTPIGSATEVVQKTTAVSQRPDAATVPVTDTTTAKTTPDSLASQPALPPYKRSVVTRRSESSTTEGFGLVFFDATSEGTDTIRLVIPNTKNPFAGEAAPRKEERQFLNLTTKATEDTVMSSDTVSKAAPRLSTSSCMSTASAGDFRKLRRDMAAADDDEGMLNEARKGFRSRCFSTEQIKNLSTLFLSDSGKYKFFDLSYEHVSDKAQFAELQSELSDSYYINRFKALIGNQ